MAMAAGPPCAASRVRRTSRRRCRRSPRGPRRAWLGIGTLTLYAFSSDNWGVRHERGSSLFGLLEEFLRTEAAACAAAGVRLRVIGRRDRIPPSLARSHRSLPSSSTAAGRALELRIAARLFLARSHPSRRLLDAFQPGSFAARICDAAWVKSPTAGGPAPDVDLLIRTGGERRLSDFMLWECAYAELLFTPRMWPEFEAADLAAAVEDFLGRERRFGRLPEAAAS